MLYTLENETLCVLVRGEEFSDAYLAFDTAEDAVSLLTNAQGTFTHRAGFHLEGDRLPLSYELFRDDVLAFHGLRSRRVTLCSRRSEKSLTVTTEGFPWLGIWSPNQGGAPFVSQGRFLFSGDNPARALFRLLDHAIIQRFTLWRTARTNNHPLFRAKRHAMNRGYFFPPPGERTPA